MRCLRLSLLLIVAAGLCGASKQSEAELRRTVAAQAAQLAAKTKENAQLQEALKAAALGHEQLAAAARDKAHVQAALDAQSVRDRAAQQELVRVAAQTAAREAAQAAADGVAQAAIKAAAKNKIELAKAIAIVNAANKQRADNATRAAGDTVTAIETSAAGVQQAVVDAHTDNAVAQAELALKLEEVKQQGRHANLLLILSALGALLSFGATLVQLINRWLRHSWATAVTTSAVTAAAKKAIAEANQSVLDAVADGQAHSAEAIEKAGYLRIELAKVVAINAAEAEKPQEFRPS